MSETVTITPYSEVQQSSPDDRIRNRKERGEQAFVNAPLRLMQPSSRVPPLNFAEVSTCTSSGDDSSGGSSNSPIGDVLKARVSNAPRQDIPMCLYMPGRKGKVIPNFHREMSAGEVVGLVATLEDVCVKRLSECFSVWVMSPFLSLQLKPKHSVYTVRWEWPHFLKKYTNLTNEKIMCDEPTVKIRRNIALSIEREQQLIALDETKKVADLLFSDAFSEFALGKYAFVDASDAAELAGLAFAVFEKDQEPKDAYLRTNIEKYLPKRHLNAVRGKLLFGRPVSRLTPLEKIVKEKWVEHSKDTHQAKLKFLEKARESPCYGAAFFDGYIEKPSANNYQRMLNYFKFGENEFAEMDVRIGVNASTLTMVDAKSGDLLLQQQLEQCDTRLLTPESEDKEHSLLVYFNSKEHDDSGYSDNEVSPDAQHTLLEIFSPQAVLLSVAIDSMRKLTRVRRISTPRSSSEDEQQHKLNARRNSFAKTAKLCTTTFNKNGDVIHARGTISRVLSVK